MWPKDFTKRLILLIAAIVIVSGLSISQIVTQKYSDSLYRAMTAQAENVAHDTALDVTEKSIENDVSALQKIVNIHMQVDPQIVYIFIIKDDQIIAQTFPQKVPTQIIKANTLADHHHRHLKNIVSSHGDRYIDVAWPILDGKNSILRLGFSEDEIQKEIFYLWVLMVSVTLGILLFAMVITYFFIKRITQPLVELAETVEKIDEDNLDVHIEINSPDEIGRLGASFKKMLDRIKEYMVRLAENANRLEEKNRQLDNAHRQTKTSFEIAKEIASLQSLKAVCEFLINKLRSIVKCQRMVLIIFSSKKSVLYSYSDRIVNTLKGAIVDTTSTLLADVKQMTFLDKSQLPYMFNELKPAKKIIVFPVHIKNQLLGGLYIGCPGDCECVTKELDIIELILNQTAGVILRAALCEDEIGDLKRRIEPTSGFAGIIGKDPQMQIIFKLIEDVAPSNATVLIQGESGTGKEMVANAIHQKSPRKDKSFIVLNCSAYPASLLESELFGHEKGAFTDALVQKPGRFELANGGTIFLDEIGEISPSAQIKLLRVLQSKKLERLGGRETLKVDARIIAATNKDLINEVKMRHFREDLFYRLNVIPINLPPLRNRRNDIPLLARHFLVRYAAIQDKTIRNFTSEAMRRLLDHSWPGNVRELENTIEHSVVLAKGEKIHVSDLPSIFLKENLSNPKNFEKRLQETERQYLIDVLERCKWNKKMASKYLGIGRSTLYVKLNKYQIKNPTYH